MRRLFLLCFLSQAVLAQTPRGVLHWQHGDSLPGKMIGASRDTLSWDTDKAAGVLEIEQAVVSHIDFKGGHVKPLDSKSWLVQTIQGDALLGEQLTLKDGQWVLQSTRHGVVQMPLQSVRKIQRVALSSNVIYLMGAGLRGWEHSQVQLQVGKIGWRMMDGTQTLQLKNCFPTQSRLDLSLESSGSMDFQLHLESAGAAGPSIQVWGSQLVLCASKTRSGHFAPALQLRQEVKRDELSFSLLWDQQTRTAELWSKEGVRLAKLEDVGEPSAITTSAAQLSQLKFQASCAELLVSELVIHHWDGRPPEASQAHQVIRTDGFRLYGKQVALSSEGIQLDQQERLPWEKVYLYESDRLLKPPASEQGLYADDGTIIHGPLQSMEKSAICLQPNWSAQPLPCKLRCPYQLILPSKDKVPLLADMDFFTGGVYQHHGKVEAAEDLSLCWRFPGARNSVPLTKMVQLGKEWSIQRATLSHGESALPTNQSLLIARNGEVLAATLKSADESSVGYHSAHSSQQLLSAERLRAVSWGSPAIQQGFRDKLWQYISKDGKGIQQGADPSGDTIILRREDRLYHPSFGSHEEISFTLEPVEDGDTMLMLCLGNKSAQPEKEDNVNFCNILVNERTVTVESTSQAARSQKLSLSAKEKIHVRIYLAEKRPEIWINGQKLFHMEEYSEPRGSGLYLQSLVYSESHEKPLRLTDFMTSQEQGNVTEVSISEARRQELLCIPRRKHDALPKQLLVAESGDTLTGQVVAATGKSLLWKTGLEEIQLPLDRVKDLIWLDPPTVAGAGERATSENSNRVWFVLRDRSQLALRSLTAGASAVKGHSGSFGPVALAWSEIRHVSNRTTPLGKGHESYQGWQLQHAETPNLPDKSNSHMLGQTAPEIDLAWLKGEGRFNLNQLRGQVLILDFWASWCGPCITSLSEMLKVMKGYHGKPLQFIAVNQGEDPAQVQRFMTARGWSFKVAMDLESKAGTAYGVEGIPHTVVVGKDGLVKWIRSGFVEDEGVALKAAVDAALAQP